jgi:hypothetical protein
MDWLIDRALVGFFRRSACATPRLRQSCRTDFANNQ